MSADAIQVGERPHSQVGQGRLDTVVLLMLVLVVLVAKLPVLQLPYHWDEMGAYFEPANWLSGRSLWDALPGRHPAEIFFGHPPLLYLAVATLYRIFGHSPAVSHGFILTLAAVGVVYTFRLARLHASRGVGVAAALLLFAFPLYFAQSGMLLGDIPIAAMGVAAVYYRLTRRPVVYAIIATMMVLVKETSVLLVLVLMAYEVWQERGGDRDWRSIVPHIYPIFALAAFFILQKVTAGSFLPNPYFKSEALLTLSPAKLIWKGAFAAYWALFAQWRFLLTAAVAVAFWRQRSRIPRAFRLYAALVAAYIVAFTGIYFIPRYMLIVAPYLCVMAAVSLRLLLPDLLRFGAALSLPVLLGLLVPAHKQSGYDSFETTMQYREVVNANGEAARVAEKLSGGGPVLAPWPLSSILANSDAGYVARKLGVTADTASDWQIALLSSQAIPEQNLSIEEAVRRSGALLIAEVGPPGKTVRIYRRERGGR